MKNRKQFQNCIARLNFRDTKRAAWSLSAEYFSVCYCISGEHSDPSCSSQGIFTSSAVQTPVSQPSGN